VRGAHGDAGERGKQQAERCARIRRKALIGLKLDHIHAYGFDDAVAADAGAKRHHHRAEHHQPHRHAEFRGRLPVHKEDAEQKHAHKLLPILRAMHKRHARAARNLRFFKKGCRFPSVQVPAAALCKPRCGKACPEPKHSGERKAVKHLHPFGKVDSVKARMQRDGRAGKPCDERMTLACGDAERPRRGRPYHDGEQRRAEGNGCLMRVAAKVHHVVNGHGHLGVDERHHEHAEEVEHRRHNDGVGRAHGARGYAGCNGVGRIRPAVYHDHAKRERHGHGQHGIAEHLRKKVCQGDRHNLLRSYILFTHFLSI